MVLPLLIGLGLLLIGIGVLASPPEKPREECRHIPAGQRVVRRYDDGVIEVLDGPIRECEYVRRI